MLNFWKRKKYEEIKEKSPATELQEIKLSLKYFKYNANWVDKEISNQKGTPAIISILMLYHAYEVYQDIYKKCKENQKSETHERLKQAFNIYKCYGCLFCANQ